MDRATPVGGPSTERRWELPADARTPQANHSRNALRESFKTRLKKQQGLVASDPGNREELLRLRVMYILLGEDDRALAPIEGLDKDEARILLANLRVLTAAKSSNGKARRSVTEDQLESIPKRWHLARVRADLVVRTAVLCSEVQDFGRYTPIEPAEFPSNRTSFPHVYIGVENFGSKLTPEGLYRTELYVRMQLLDASGRSLKGASAGKTVDFCRTQRRDLYLTIRRLEIPGDLAPGEYSLEIEVKDLLEGRRSTKSVGFTIVP